jgi:hypothetical protein
LWGIGWRITDGPERGPLGEASGNLVGGDRIRGDRRTERGLGEAM